MEITLFQALPLWLWCDNYCHRTWITRTDLANDKGRLAGVTWSTTTKDRFTDTVTGFLANWSTRNVATNCWPGWQCVMTVGNN